MATATGPGTQSVQTVSSLMQMSQRELDQLFTSSPPGEIPNGESSGTAIVCPGTFWARLISRFVRRVAWRGKVFTKSPDGNDATLQNKIGVAGTQLIVARVYFPIAGSMENAASSSTTPRPRSSPAKSGTKSARSHPVSIWERCGGAKLG